MITYNWLKVYQLSNGNPSNILDIIAYLTFRPLPKNNYDPIKKYATINWAGDSFLLNSSAVIYNRSKCEDKELAEYVALASFRSLAEYSATKRTTLSILECPITLESVNKNKLLSIAGDNIYFAWEETTQ